MRISFITTVLNEEKTIVSFLNSIFCQSKFPDEIIIVDAGSTDGTISKISNFKFPGSNQNAKIKLIFKKGNRAVGRNEAIKNSSGEIIACSDVGCILGRDWVKNIIEPFRNSKVDVVAGYYKPIVKNIFEKCLSTYTCVMEDKLNSDVFLPSSRSIGFKKSVWKTVGGYPEHLDTCEDLVFAKKLKDKDYNFFLAKNAVVYWPQRKTFGAAFYQFYNYAKGDGTARYFRPQTPFLFARYIVGLIILAIFFILNNYVFLKSLSILFALYILWSIIKNYQYINNFMAIYYLPLIQIISDVAVISGTSVGLFSLKKRNVEK
jgi:glycosyltransferase involved in cell wall biosynthesis